MSTTAEHQPNLTHNEELLQLSEQFDEFDTFPQIGELGDVVVGYEKAEPTDPTEPTNDRLSSGSRIIAEAVVLATTYDELPEAERQPGFLISPLDRRRELATKQAAAREALVLSDEVAAQEAGERAQAVKQAMELEKVRYVSASREAINQEVEDTVAQQEGLSEGAAEVMRAGKRDEVERRLAAAREAEVNKNGGASNIHQIRRDEQKATRVAEAEAAIAAAEVERQAEIRRIKGAGVYGNKYGLNDAPEPKAEQTPLEEPIRPAEVSQHNWLRMGAREKRTAHNQEKAAGIDSEDPKTRYIQKLAVFQKEHGTLDISLMDDDSKRRYDLIVGALKETESKSPLSLKQLEGFWTAQATVINAGNEARSSKDPYSDGRHALQEMKVRGQRPSPRPRNIPPVEIIPVVDPNVQVPEPQPAETGPANPEESPEEFADRVHRERAAAIYFEAIGYSGGTVEQYKRMMAGHPIDEVLEYRPEVDGGLAQRIARDSDRLIQGGHGDNSPVDQDDIDRILSGEPYLNVVRGAVNPDARSNVDFDDRASRTATLRYLESVGHPDGSIITADDVYLIMNGEPLKNVVRYKDTAPVDPALAPTPPNAGRFGWRKITPGYRRSLRRHRGQ